MGFFDTFILNINRCIFAINNKITLNIQTIFYLLLGIFIINSLGCEVSASPPPGRPVSGDLGRSELGAAAGTQAGQAVAVPSEADARRLYPWSRRREGYESLASRILPPSGFTRVALSSETFGSWLRHLPLLPAGSPVRSFKGSLILDAQDPGLAAVVDLDLSRRDRQQCADTIMRLWGEFLDSRGQSNALSLLWAGGKRFSVAQWRQGIRPVRQGKGWAFIRKASPSSGRASLRAYLEFMFGWTGSLHLQGERPVMRGEVQPGDFLIQGGSPGHAVMLLDIAKSPSGETVALIGQGFMPAQDLHVLRGPDGSPWFRLDLDGQGVRTPFWFRSFRRRDLRRFGR